MHRGRMPPRWQGPPRAWLADRHGVRAEKLVPGSDIMGDLKPGVTTLTNRGLGTMVVTVSDNSATSVLIDRVGMSRVPCSSGTGPTSSA